MRFALLMLILSAAAMAVDTSGDEVTNKKLLAKWKTDPEHAERLKQGLAAFRAMPIDRQEKLRKLDKDLFEQGAMERERLLTVMEKYAGWLARLNSADRASIEAADTG